MTEAELERVDLLASRLAPHLAAYGINGRMLVAFCATEVACGRFWGSWWAGATRPLVERAKAFRLGWLTREAV